MKLAAAVLGNTVQFIGKYDDENQESTLTFAISD
jgi:hypothetical protein